MLFVQRNNGTIASYFGYAPETYGDPPSFQRVPEEAFPGIVTPGHQNIAPAGMAVADFDGDGLAEIITVYQHNEGGSILQNWWSLTCMGRPKGPPTKSIPCPILLGTAMAISWTRRSLNCLPRGT